VPLSFGDTDVAEYVWQLAADHLIHSWDLSAAIGTDRRFDPALVAGVAGWFAEREEIYRSSGAVAPRAISHGGPQGDLLATFGRDSEWGPNHACAARFLRAFGSGDVDACLVEMTPDCVFEATGPAPDGVRHEGADAVRAVWAQMFADTTDPAFTTEEQVVAGDRAMFRWSYGWTGADGTPGHVRGVDVVRFRDGRICEKLSYVKG
jgi:ketosteroid isomerase-like protein